GHAPLSAVMSPDGSLLVCPERPGYDTDAGSPPKDATIVWNLATGERRKLADEYVRPPFAPDGKTVVVQANDYEAKKSGVRVLDAATFAELAKLESPDTERMLSLSGLSPDGSVVALALGGKKGAPREVLFRDAKTLEDRGRFAGEANPEGYGWGGGKF